MNELQQAWENSHFKATKNELITEILPKALKNVSTIDPSTITHQKTIVNPPAFTLWKRRNILMQNSSSIESIIDTITSLEITDQKNHMH
ncbi:unnamed protein product [Rotaria socialis]|uniref:Uncharacterized protein n=1 Tax=Rotaria socialis TaxID=392032 RepID=A0A817YLI8_9BILA|nr:unnamed protein product [Rotaria socialis]CAF3379966.1 unnamed protein product [Rotaria socialis]CAF4371726.1 unnamed protein product [Rotaria socialis]CAF4477780.1 unnamed protein product [Rotaria socialis]